jgi:hypothetical protein
VLSSKQISREEDNLLKHPKEVLFAQRTPTVLMVVESVSVFFNNALNQNAHFILFPERVAVPAATVMQVDVDHLVFLWVTKGLNPELVDNSANIIRKFEKREWLSKINISYFLTF